MAVSDEWELWFPDAYEIGSESVRAFARATRNPHIPYAASRIIPADTIVPSTMLGAPMMHIGSALVAQRLVGCNMSAILHAGQTFHFHRPLRIGDILSVGAKLTSHIVKADTDLITVVCMGYVNDEPSISAEIFIAHSQRETGVDLEAADKLADEIMMTGTGPSMSDDYAAKVASPV